VQTLDGAQLGRRSLEGRSRRTEVREPRVGDDGLQFGVGPPEKVSALASFVRVARRISARAADIGRFDHGDVWSAPIARNNVSAFSNSAP
jgi:hypothetical protein